MEIQIEQMNPSFTKYHINPEGKLPIPIRPVIHHFTAPDVGEEPHCHPFNFTSYVLYGGYWERIFYRGFNVGYTGPYETWDSYDTFRSPGTSHIVTAGTIHQLISLPKNECVTCIIAGPKVKEPCFYRFENGKAFVRQWNETEFNPFNP